MSLIPVTKKNNPDFAGFATPEQIAKNPNLIIAGSNHTAKSQVEKAVEQIAEKKAFDDSVEAAKPSEAVKPSDVKRKP